MAVQEIQQINANRNKQNSESFLTQESYDLTQINPLFLSNLSLDDLAKTYVNIQKQSQLLQGMILLEARNKFAGDLEFGKWISDNGLDTGSQQQRNRCMNLARFFKDREMEGITISVAFELSAPKNADKADKLYAEIKGKNISYTEFKKKIIGNIETSIEELRIKAPTVDLKHHSKTDNENENDDFLEDHDLLDLSMHEDIFEDSKYPYNPNTNSIPTPFKKTMIESSENLEETVVHILLGDMTNDQKLVFIERCKEMILSEMGFNTK